MKNYIKTWLFLALSSCAFTISPGAHAWEGETKAPPLTLPLDMDSLASVCGSTCIVSNKDGALLCMKPVFAHSCLGCDVVWIGPEVPARMDVAWIPLQSCHKTYPKNHPQALAAINKAVKGETPVVALFELPDQEPPTASAFPSPAARSSGPS